MISPEDQERLSRLADLAESDAPLPTQGKFTHNRGLAASADVRELLRQAEIEFARINVAPNDE